MRVEPEATVAVGKQAKEAALIRIAEKNATAFDMVPHSRVVNAQWAGHRCVESQPALQDSPPTKE